MRFYDTILLAVALGMDAFSVAVVIGTQQYNLKQVLKISGVIGFFHILMPVLGLLSGQFIRQIIRNVFALNTDIENLFELIGAGLLLLIGFYMMIETFIDDREDLKTFECSTIGLLVLALSVSIDSFAVGISLGMIEFSIVMVVIIGLVASLMMASGLYIGSILGYNFKINTQFWGGLALIILGLRFSGLF